ncbi:sugar ABC transporter permease [Agrobacterium vitis]|uniref:Sugar ABC transporter permease n=2 Tax=Pseudomonadota TaxID=1224 RepID=A0AAE2RAG0_AGRVI|nr:sugar ABC transporter permease [Agrobacterium vitis]
MTLWFSFQHYNLVNTAGREFVGLDNYLYFFSSSSLAIAALNSIYVVLGVIAITVTLGIGLVLLLDRDFVGAKIARVLAISPFFVMPTVAALIWKNLLLDPVNGLLATVLGLVGLPAVDWFGTLPMFSIIVIIAWQWIGFSTLILLTALQSLDHELKEAAAMDGAGAFATFRFIVLPHLARPIGIIVMIETIFLLSVFAEIFVTTSGGPGLASTNLSFLIYVQALLRFDVGLASAGGVISIILANVVAYFLAKTVSRSLEI